MVEDFVFEVKKPESQLGHFFVKVQEQSAKVGVADFEFVSQVDFDFVQVFSDLGKQNTKPQLEIHQLLEEVQGQEVQDHSQLFSQEYSLLFYLLLLEEMTEGWAEVRVKELVGVMVEVLVDFKRSLSKHFDFAKLKVVFVKLEQLMFVWFVHFSF